MEKIVNLTANQLNIIKNIIDSHSDDVLDLARIAGLDPAKAFRNATLKGVVFGKSNLEGFDFRGADFQGVDMTEVVFEHALFDEPPTAGHDDRGPKGGMAASIISSIRWQAKTNIRIRDLAHRVRSDYWFTRQTATQELSSDASLPEAREILVEALKDKTWSVRLIAARSLAPQIEQPEVCDALVRALEDSDGDVRLVALQALAALVQDAHIRDAIRPALLDRELRVRRAATQALAAYATEPATQHYFNKSFSDQNEDVRLSSMRVLANHADTPATLFLGMLESEHPDQYVYAIRGLTRQVHVPEVRAALIRRLQDQRHLSRAGLVDALEALAGEDDVAAVLTAALHDWDPEVRAHSLAALVAVSPPAVAVDMLCRAVNDKNRSTRLKATKALSAYCSHEAACVAFRMLLADPDAEIRMIAGSSLADTVARTRDFHALVSVAESNYPDTRLMLVQALIPFAAAPVVRDVLIRALNDADTTVRQGVAWSLAAQAEVPGVSRLLSLALTNGDDTVRQTAAAGIPPEAIGPAELESLRAMAKDQSARKRKTVMRTLARFSSNADICSDLIGALSDGDLDIRREAIQALGGMLQDPVVRDALCERLSGSLRDVRLGAVRLLATIGDWAERCRTLCGALMAPYPDVRESAVKYLAPHTEDPVVQRTLCDALMTDGSYAVRLNAAAALAGTSSKPAIHHAMLKALRDSHPEVMIAAIRELAAHAGKPGTLQELLGLLQHDSVHVREAVVRVLAGQVKDTAVEVCFCALLQDQSVTIREVVVRSLAMVRNRPNVRAVLLTALRGDVWSVRRTAIRALAPDVNEPEVRAALCHATSDMYSEIREAAFSALERTSGPDIFEAAQMRLNDENKNVRIIVDRIIKYYTENQIY